MGSEKGQAQPSASLAVLTVRMLSVEPGKGQAQPSASLTMPTMRMLICGAGERTSSVICFAGHEDAVSGVRKRTVSAICFVGHADREDADLWGQDEQAQPSASLAMLT